MNPYFYYNEINCLEKWDFDDEHEPLNFYGWGIEIGNWFGFFSHENSGGVACKVLQAEFISNHDEITSNFTISLPKATFQLSVQDLILNRKSIIRKFSIINSSTKISWIGDCVIRTAIPLKEKKIKGFLENETVQHNGYNFYRDTEDDIVSLIINNSYKFKNEFIYANYSSPNITKYNYLRDQPKNKKLNQKQYTENCWIIHSRLLVDFPSAYVFRFAKNPFVFWDRHFVGNILFKYFHLKHYWRRCEWGAHGRGATYGLWALKPQEKLELIIKNEITTF